MDDIKLFAKKTRKKWSNKNIQLGYWNGIWHKKYSMLIMTRGIRQITEGIKLSNQKK